MREIRPCYLVIFSVFEQIKIHLVGSCDEQPGARAVEQTAIHGGHMCGAPSASPASVKQQHLPSVFIACNICACVVTKLAEALRLFPS